MLKDIIPIFEKIYKEYGDKLIIDSYTPVDGTYVIIEPSDNTFKIKECVDIKYNKKNKELSGKSNMYYFDICSMDYNSKIIDMNKPIDKSKIIHSNNFYSFFIKKDSLTSNKLNNKIIDEYYEILKNPYKKYSSGKAKTLYEAVEKEMGKPNIERVEKIQEWIKENIFNLNIDISGKDYLKIFFDYPIEEYLKENKRYLIPNIYNKNDFNINVGDKIYGLPNDNMGLNAKKPYLENKTRKSTVSYLIDNKEVLIQRKFFEYLMNMASVGKVNIYIDDKIIALPNGESIDRDFQGVFIRLQKGKEVEIHDYDVITKYRYTLRKPFKYKNILDLDLNSKNIQSDIYDNYYNLKEIQNLINDVVFRKFLKSNYFTEAKDIKINESYLKGNLLQTRDIIFNWIYKGEEGGIYAVLDKAIFNILKGTLLDGGIIRACHQFNLRWSFKEYYKGEDNMADKIIALKKNLRLKINNEVTGKFDSDDEYYFGVGQIVSYLLSKNKGKKKPHSLANPFINAKDNKVIKEKLRNFYKKYNYDIDMNGRRFKNLYAMILGYEADTKVNQDMIIAGYLNNNLIYESDKKEEEING